MSSLDFTPLRAISLVRVPEDRAAPWSPALPVSSYLPILLILAPSPTLPVIFLHLAFTFLLSCTQYANIEIFRF